MKRKAFPQSVWIILALLLLLLGIRLFQERALAPESPAAQVSDSASKEQNAPSYVLEVLRQVRATQKAPSGYVGGRNFENRERRLPGEDPFKQPIRYREWDVHPRQTGKNRGAERLVTGSDHSAWYTSDHYKTFKRIE